MRQEEEFELMAAIGAAAFLEEMSRAESKNSIIALLEPLAQKDADFGAMQQVLHNERVLKCYKK